MIKTFFMLSPPGRETATKQPVQNPQTACGGRGCLEWSSIIRVEPRYIKCGRINSTTVIPALVIGREGSEGFPGKNVSDVLGRSLCWYPIKAAQEADEVDSVYVSTDFDKIASLGRDMGANIIERDPSLATSDASAYDVFKDGIDSIDDAEGEDIEAVALLLCNSPTLTARRLDEGITSLRDNENLDSVVSASRYNMHSPLRAKKHSDGKLVPYVPPKEIEGASPNRDSQPDTYFLDGSFFVIRPRCLKDGIGQLPYNWIGDEVGLVENQAGLDIDYRWQVPQAKHWLLKHGFSDDETPYN
jgi:CMP-N-acetylneuraminic acid synthetase